MSKVGAEIELFIREELYKYNEEAKKDKHEQNQRLQTIVSKQDEKMDKLLEKAENLFAKKWVEKAGWGIIVMVFSALGTALMTLLLK